MYVLENPVLQRELLVNLRMPRAFVLLFFYQAVLAVVVFFAWPQEARLDMTEKSGAARKLVDMFFLGQFILASLMAPSFAAGAITGEKERKTYEMLLASPLKPSAIVFGKLVASLTHVGMLIFTSLPIVMLCLPLGGVSIYEVLAAYFALIVSVVTFGSISLACSSFFKRTLAALVVSYLLILPMALVGALTWHWLSDYGEFRLILIVTLLPAVSAAICIALHLSTSRRLLRPPDVGSEGNDVVDLDEEAKQAVGLVIRRDQWPDKLFAPPKRDALIEDGANPVYDKEIRSEIFSQGTLMLRLVIQVSMLLAIPLMAFCLYIMPQYAPWYIAYVLIFNVLVGPVFSAGSVTGERERQTLDLLLTTTIAPWKILWGKLIASLRVSSVLTLFLLWPLLLACLMVSSYWSNLLAVLAYVVIVLVTCVTTAVVGLFSSVMFRKTSVSLMGAYVIILILFMAPLAVSFFAKTFFPDRPSTRYVDFAGITSPFSAAFNVPVDMDDDDQTEARPALGAAGARTVLDRWLMFLAYLVFSIMLCSGLLVMMIWMFQTRWRVSATEMR